MRWVTAAAVLLVMVGGFAAAGAASAQDGDDDLPTIRTVEAELNGDAIEGDEEPDGDDSAAKITRARQTLIAIAALMTVALIAFWWHTVPSRRLRVATRRLASHQATNTPIDPDTDPDSDTMLESDTDSDSGSGPTPLSGSGATSFDWQQSWIRLQGRLFGTETSIDRD